MARSDTQLLRAFVEKSDEAAFGELVTRRIDFVYGCALRQVGGDAHRAADIAQEVFVALARRAPTLIHHPALLGWLCTATRFASVDAIRSEQKRRVREQEASAMQLTELEDQADWTRLQPVLDAALAELSAGDRDVVLARFFDRQSFADIARGFGLTENAAQKRVDRALGRLREALTRRNVTSTTAALGLVLSSQAGVSAPAGLALSITKSALSAAASGMTVGGVSWALILMNKYGLGLASAAASLGVATAVIGLRAEQAAQRALESSRKVNASLAAEVRSLEQRVQLGSERIQRAEETNAALLRQTASVPTAAAPNATAEPEVITAELVSRRFKLARELVDHGDPALALKELIWCYDVGMPRVSSVSGVRITSLSAFARLGERYPAAWDELRQRRNNLRVSAQAESAPYELLSEYAALNRALKDEAESIALMDTLPPGDRRRGALAGGSHDFLVKNRRYHAALEGRPYSSISSLFEQSSRYPRPAGIVDPAAQRAYLEPMLKRAAADVEVLAGAGEIAQARAHAARVLDFDNTESTRTLLQQGAARAGLNDLFSTAASP